MVTRPDLLLALANGDGAAWLLELDFRGRLYRVTDYPGGVTIDGVVFEPGLGTVDPDSSGELRAVTLEIDIGEDWAALAAEGFPLDWGVGTLRRWWPGQAFAEAEVVLSGIITDPEYGAADEPLVVTLEPEIHREPTMLDPLAVADSTTWPPVEVPGFTQGRLPDRNAGMAYPLVIGIPGHPEPGRGLAYPAVPALLVQYAHTEGDEAFPWPGSKVLVAGHRMAAHEVRLWMFDGDTARHDNLIPQTAEDEAGNLVTYVTFEDSSAFGEEWADGVELWTGYGSNILGGILGRDGKMLRGAGDVLEWALVERGGFRVDLGRLAAAKDYLNRYQVDTYVNDTSMGVWEWVEGELLKLLPVVLLESAEGLYVKVIRWDPDEARRHAVAHLDADARQVHRTSSLTSVRDELHNRIEVRYRPSRGDQWVSRVVVDAHPRAGDSRVIGDARCLVSQARYEMLPYTVDASWVWDDATAERIALDLAGRMALPKRQVAYSGGPELELVEPWDVVTVTDSEVSLREAVAYVSERRLTEEGVDLELLLLAGTVG